MIRLSPAAELAIRGTLAITESYGNGPVSLKAICREHALPREYLVKIFASLSKAGVIVPVRGKNGGYRLARSPEQINLRQIIEAVEGPIALNLCQHSPAQCDRVTCPVRPVWSQLQGIVCDKLDSAVLSDLLASPTDAKS